MPIPETLDLTAPRRRGRKHLYRQRQLWSLRPGRPPVAFELVSIKCGLLKTMGAYEKSSAILAAHLPQAEAIGDRRWAAKLASQLAYSLLVQGQPGAGLPHGERAKLLFAELGDAPGMADLLHTLAGIYSDLGQSDRACQLTHELLELAERTCQPGPAVQAIYQLREELGLDRALERIRGHLEKARQDKDHHLMAMACFYLGDIYMNTGRWAEAEACNLEQCRLAYLTGNRSAISFSIGDRGLIFYGQGKYREAIECFLEKLDISEAMGDFYNIFEALNNLGAAHHQLGETETALGYLRRAEAHARRHQIQHHLCKTLSLMALCLEEIGDLRRATQANTEALEIARDIGYSFVVFSCSLLEARLAAASDKERGLAMMEGLLAGSEEDEQRAMVCYEMHRLTGDPKHKSAALEHYRKHYQRSRLFDVARRIEELEAK